MVQSFLQETICHVWGYSLSYLCLCHVLLYTSCLSLSSPCELPRLVSPAPDSFYVYLVLSLLSVCLVVWWFLDLQFESCFSLPAFILYVWIFASVCSFSFCCLPVWIWNLASLKLIFCFLFVVFVQCVRMICIHQIPQKFSCYAGKLQHI